MSAGTVRPTLGHVGRAIAVFLVVLLAVAAGIGWLYALRDIHALKIGPKLADALPLQRLAHGAAQPLGRLIAAWLPTGIVAGFGISLVSRMRRPARAVVVFVESWVLVLAAAAVADALTHNEPLRRHLHEQPHRAATWVAAGLMALGALAAPVMGFGAGRQAS